MGVIGSCHCGAVTVEVATAPTEVTSCNCSICRRIAGLWAYYAPEDVRVSGATATYRWGDEMLDLHRCETCGCTTHWTLTEKGGKGRMGVNARLLDPEILAAASVRRVDGASAPLSNVDE